MSIKLIKGGPISEGFVITCTQPLKLQVSAIHSESISFFITRTQTQAVILGLPWLQLQKPQISWQEREILQWPTFCHLHSLRLPELTIASTSVERLDASIRVHIPECYHTHIEAFSKGKAIGLPAHRPYDCTIDLLPGTMPPCCQIYPLVISEQGAVKDYVQEALQQGYTSPST